MMARNPHGQNLPAASHGRARTSRAEAAEMLDSGHGDSVERGLSHQHSPQHLALAWHSNITRKTSQEAPAEFRLHFPNAHLFPGQQIHPRLAAGREKFSGVVGPWMVSIPHPTAPAARLCLSVECPAKGILPRAFS